MMCVNETFGRAHASWCSLMIFRFSSRRRTGMLRTVVAVGTSVLCCIFSAILAAIPLRGSRIGSAESGLPSTGRSRLGWCRFVSSNGGAPFDNLPIRSLHPGGISDLIRFCGLRCATNRLGICRFVAIEEFPPGSAHTGWIELELLVEGIDVSRI